MLRTIEIKTCMSAQGLLVRRLAGRRIVVRVDDKLYSPLPVERGPLPRPV